MLFDNRPLVQIKKYIEHCNQHISDKSSLEYQNAFIRQAKWEQNRYREELKKLIESKECCSKKFLILDYEGNVTVGNQSYTRSDYFILFFFQENCQTN